MRILIATTNPGKIGEYQEILADSGMEMLSLRDAGIAVEVEETGATFEENARLKARAYADLSGLPTLADDSGVCVDALDSAPGVYSARFGPDPVSRIERLLAALADVPDERRTARFVCVIALARPGEETVTFEGVCEGRIGWSPRGNNGFGYDPIFYLPEYGQTMAELSSALKNRVSHRGRAAARLRVWLANHPLQGSNA